MSTPRSKRNPGSYFPKQPNFLTPDIQAYGWLPSGEAWELSAGRPLFLEDHPDGRMYGVTVSGKVGGDALNPASKGGFRTKQDALDYIGGLQGAVK